MSHKVITPPEKNLGMAIYWYIAYMYTCSSLVIYRILANLRWFVTYTLSLFELIFQCFRGCFFSRKVMLQLLAEKIFCNPEPDWYIAVFPKGVFTPSFGWAAGRERWTVGGIYQKIVLGIGCDLELPPKFKSTDQQNPYCISLGLYPPVSHVFLATYCRGSMSPHV